MQCLGYNQASNIELRDCLRKKKRVRIFLKLFAVELVDLKCAGNEAVDNFVLKIKIKQIVKEINSFVHLIKIIVSVICQQ